MDRMLYHCQVKRAQPYLTFVHFYLNRVKRVSLALLFIRSILNFINFPHARLQLPLILLQAPQFHCHLCLINLTILPLIFKTFVVVRPIAFNP